MSFLHRLFHARPVAALGTLLGARIAGRVLGALTGVLLARVLGPGGFGQLAGALAVVALAAPLVQGSVDAATLRALARGRTDGFLRSAIGAKLWIGALLVLGLALVAIPLDLSLLVALLALNALVASVGGAVQTWWVAGEEQAKAAAAEVARSVAWLVAAGAVWLWGGGVLGVAAARTVATAVLVVALLAIVSRRTDVRPSFGGQREVLRQSLVFLVSGFFFIVYQQADRLMLLVMAGDVEAGRYAAAANLVAVFYMVPGIFTTVFLPRMYRQAGDRAREKRVLEIRLGSGLVLATLIVPVLIGFRGELLSFLYGQAYVGAAAVLLWLGGTVLLRFLAVSYGDLITAADRQPRRMAVQAGAAGTNILLNFLLIPRWGAPGAAAATLASESLLLVGYIVTVRRLGMPTKPRLLVPGALACTGVTMAWLWQPWLGAAAMAAVAGYGVRRLAASS